MSSLRRFWNYMLKLLNDTIRLFSPSVSLVHKWANAVAAEMRALHWGAERIFAALVGGCAVYAAELACSYFLEREGGRR